MEKWTCTRQGELYHHGIKGQKWGVRRFQNKDGSLTPAGKRRYDEPNIGRKTSESVTVDGQTFKVYGRNNKQYADEVAKKAKDMGATVSRESKPKETKKLNSIDGTKVYSKHGVEVSLQKQPTSLIAKAIGKISKKSREYQEKSDFMDVKVGGKTVGDLQLYREDKKSINVVWVSINEGHEGQGYGKAVMQAVVDHAKKQGLDRVTLEVPGVSPNARHIYESLGFEATKVLSEQDAWGGLTAMELKLKK